jgi:twinkle protein
MLVLPSAKSVVLPEKDANDCLIAGKAKAAYTALAYNAVKPKNSRLVYGEDIHDVAREPAKYGDLTWPFPKLNLKTRGIRTGETIYVGAGVKMGKSEFLNELAAHFIEEHGVKVFMAKPEESNKKTYKLLAGKIARKPFHDPDVEFDFEAYDKAGKILKDKLVMVNLYQHLGWESLKEDISAAAVWGAKVIFIDPITNLTNGQDSASVNTHLAAISQELSAMALDLNVTIFIFCHLKAPEGNLSKDQRQNKYAQGKYTSLGNCPHELGGDVLSAQFAGSRAMMRSCNYMIGLEGNKDDTLPEEVRNTRVIRILEDREFGEVGSIPVYWNRASTRFIEI